jgi:DNA repair exonuclease SbcCD ATPase subunit
MIVDFTHSRVLVFRNIAMSDATPEVTDQNPTVKDFLKRHVRGIPREKMKSKVFYGFKYKDLKAFINEIISRHSGADQAELLVTISELELKLKSARAYKAQMEEKTAEAARRLKELQSRPADETPAVDNEALARLEEEKAALARELEEHKTRAAEHESSTGKAAEELAALTEEYAKLESESEFLDSEMEKLSASNTQLEGQVAELGEKAAKAAEQEAQLAATREQIASLEGVIAASKDMQKVKAMRDELDRITKALAAWESAGEFVAAERMPDYALADTAAQNVITALDTSDVPLAKEIKTAAAALQSKLALHRDEFAALVEQMYDFQGDIKTAYRLGQLCGQDMAQSGHAALLESLAKKVT